MTFLRYCITFECNTNFMTKHFIFILNFICIISFGQQPLHHRVKIKGTMEQFKMLASLGLAMDHGERNSDYFITELSDKEIDIIKANNVPYEIVITDVTKYYQNRNKVSSSKINNSDQTGCNIPDIKTPTHFKYGSMGGYYTLAEMEQELDSMKLLFPNLITIKQAISPIQTIEGRNIYYVKISDNPNADENEPEMFYNSLIHAREPAGMSQLIFYMWHLLENYQTNTEVKTLVDNTEMYFVPCINPDGYVYNESTNPNGGGMWRKNRRDNGDGTFGVDLNRNFGYLWGYDNVGSSDITNSNTYRGVGPFSEPETQAVRDFCLNRNFKFCINQHTYGDYLIYPWSYTENYLTPDSTSFKNWSSHLTEESGYRTGTCNQVLNYTANGAADDWMYGEQGIKPKLLSMTSEAGASSDGFWPQQTRIIDICKQTLRQNLNADWLIINQATISDASDKFITQTSGYLKYDIKRLGLENGTFTVSVNPISSSFSSIGPAKTYNNLAINQTQSDSISFSLNSSIQPNTQLKFIYELDNGFFIFRDTITKIFGAPVTVFSDHCDNLSQWTGSNIYNTPYLFYSPPQSIYTSVQSEFESNIALINQSLDLTNAINAHLQFQVKFRLENDARTEIWVSTDNWATRTSLCGKYTKLTDDGFGQNIPAYLSKMWEWKKEDVDLSAYCGQNINLGFLIQQDMSMYSSSIYFDDVLIRKLVLDPLSVNEKENKSHLKIYPNPAKTYITIESTDKIESYKILNQLGEIIKEGLLTLQAINIESLSSGIYHLQVITKKQKIYTHKLVVSQ